MAKNKDQQLIVGLDIGTTKVVALLGEVNELGGIEVIAMGSYPSKGLKKGVVVDIEQTVTSIQRAIEELELMSGCDIHAVYADVAGGHIHGMNSHGIVPIQGKEVEAEDVEKVLSSARAVALPADQKILHVLPQDFIIDGQSGIREPLGMAGVRLEANAHIVTGSVGAVQNIIKCIEQCGLTAADIVLEQLASSYAVLTADEKELGVCMIDIGGGTTDIAIFTGGAIQYTGVVPIAGNQVTRDIAISLETPIESAEKLKVEQANAEADKVDKKHTVDVLGIGGRESRAVSAHLLAQVVSARYEELFELVLKELSKKGINKMPPAGVVITGGGSRVKGLLGLAEQVFRVKVRVGLPKFVKGLPEVIDNPIYATGIGLLIYAQQQSNVAHGGLTGHSMNNLWSRMKGWFQGNF